MAQLRIITDTGAKHVVSVQSNRTKFIILAAKTVLPDVKAAVFMPVTASSLVRYALYDKAGAFMGEATYLAPMGG